MLVIGHRGASGHAPENTVAAFRKAVSLGAAFIETDLQLSRDTHFVAIHDATVDRTTAGHAAVHHLPPAGLHPLRAPCLLRRELSAERHIITDSILVISNEHHVS